MAQPQIVNNTNVMLIDCNRISSEEGKTNNNNNQAIFTNNISDGLKLDTGDKVSVHSAYINELGCGSQTLETTGKIIGDFTYRYTEIELERGQKHIEYGPYKAKSVQVKNLETVETVKDNEAVFTMSYYKTTNGENYLHLPRRFDTNIDVLSTGTYTVPRDYLPAGGAQQIPTPAQLHATADPGKNDGGYQETRITARQKAWWQHDSTDTGRSFVTPIYRCLDDWTFYTGKSAYTGWSKIFNRGTERADRAWEPPSGTKKEYHIAPGANTAEFQPGPSATGNKGYDVNEWRKRNDNSKYTIYMMTRTLYTKDSANVAKDDYFASFSDLEPCWHNYIRYLELKKYEISPGFNDPNNVAYQLTSQLTDKSEPEQIKLSGALNSANDPVDFDTNDRIVSEPRYDCPISMSIEGNVFKPFACANWYTLQESNFTKYSTFSVSEQEEIDYLSSYQTIGIKRPEFYDAGRDSIKHNFVDPKNPTNLELIDWRDYRIGSQGVNKVLETSEWCNTTIPFTEPNLKAISKFLKTQELYPELLVFDDRDEYRPTPPRSNLNLSAQDVPYKSDTPALQTSLMTNSATRTTGIDNPVYEKRFLHIDGYEKADEAAMPGRVSKIGCDGYLSTDTDQNVSLPLFFHYDRLNEDKDSSEISGANQFNLVYGFASFYLDTVSNVKCIRLYLKDGLPQVIATQGGTAGEPENYIGGRGIGFDRHFNAYGNSAIMLYSGMFPENYYGNEKISAPSLVGGSTIAKIRESTNNDLGKTLPINGENQAWEISKYIRQIYLGAISPIIKFDPAQSRFVFNGLHTPEYIQNEADAGFKSSDTATPVPDTDDAGTEVYKINKVLTLTNNFCPDMLPYRVKSSYNTPINASGDTVENIPSTGYGGNSTIKVTRVCGYSAAKDSDILLNNYPTGGAPPTGYSTLEQPAISTGTGPVISTQQEYVESHKALQKYTVFDAQCGIFLEDFGIKEDLWDKSIWNILGWDYEQLTSEKVTSYDIDKGPTGALNRQYRLTRTNSNQILGITTNADVGLNDIPLYKMNVWNKSQYTLQMPVPMEPDIWYGWMSQRSAQTTINSETKLYQMIDDIHSPVVYPTIVVTQTSTNLTANNLPIKMTLPYYLIKSNIIADSFYIKDKTPLPIVSVVNKENGFGDYYFSGESILEFTITQPTTLSFIRTEIFDADMSYAKVDKNSAIIYKIEKQVPQNLDLAQEILKAAQNKSKNKNK